LKATGTSAREQPGAPAAAGSIGILGGTFNPPHLGHLTVARCAREELALEHVMLMPAHIPPHKQAAADTAAEQRLQMCALLAEDSEGISASALEIERGGASYTVDTLRAVHAKHPKARLTFILGADTACTLASWREPAQLLELADLAVATRSGSSRAAVLDTVAALTGPPREGEVGARVRFLEMGPIEVSSSMVRKRVAHGEPIEELVGAALARYISTQDLYRASIGAAS